MAKLLLVSVVFALVAIPVLASRDRSAARGLRRALLLTVAFNAAYYLALRYVLPRLYG